MNYRQFRKMLVATIALSVGACGGGGGGEGVNSTPPPPPSPTPSPTPTPTPALVQIFPNVTNSSDFATLGYEAAGKAGATVGSGFSVTYDALSGAYVMDVPASEPGVFRAYTSGDRYWNGRLSDPATGTDQPIFLNVFRPGPQNWDFANLTYTTFAEYDTGSGHFGVMAFGQPTPGGAVPVTGSATYNGFAAGQIQVDGGSAIRGDVMLNFNFGAGTLSGSFDPYVYDLLAGNTPLGHYTFANTVFGVGSTNFSGELSRAGMSERGAFEGLFTGPNAQELMARWTAPLPDPATNSTTRMFGVWVGRRP